MRIIGFHGPARSGKDEAARVAIERFGFRRVAFADPLREMAMAIDPIIDCTHDEPVRYGELVALLGYDEAKEQFAEIRTFLQRLGTDAVRNVLGAEVWVNLWRARVAALPADARVVVTDVRFDNEAAAVRSQGGVVVQLVRPSQDPLPEDHVSERAIDPRLIDQILLNDSTLLDYHARIARLITERLERWA